MVTTIGIFADLPTASTGMAVVCHNIARQLAKLEKWRVIYFGRYGWKGDGPFAPEEQTQLYKGYEYVPSEGGVWKYETVKKAIEIYNIDIVFSEDDWFSVNGLVRACKATRKPLHFLTPIDSLPIHPEAFKIFKQCKKVYVPNSSFKKISNGVELPHGVNGLMFQPLIKPKQKRIFKKFTFLWIGRNEIRKAMGRAILAFRKIYDKADVQMVIRSDWTTDWGKKTALYLSRHKELPIIRDIMTDVEHGYMQQVYANCDVLVITSKAGGFELQSLEGQACGLPVLVTDWTFMNETVVDGKGGFVIPIADTEMGPKGLGRIWGNISIDALAEKMLWCATHQEEVKSLGNWAKKHVVENYRWDKIAETLYKEMGL